MARRSLTFPTLRTIVGINARVRGDDEWFGNDPDDLDRVARVLDTAISLTPLGPRRLSWRFSVPRSPSWVYRNVLVTEAVLVPPKVVTVTSTFSAVPMGLVATIFVLLTTVM